ncbi:hypothetical protein NQ317_018056 [Molorchus minor]|uniref:Uncharacterized protein n=1 Tax=Molorchus minor TaxID=1323400 RepID=A0ABQ9JFH3_9CUCU|nr:hypothetical protein NQ317_018056 [Molorchus minor]
MGSAGPGSGYASRNTKSKSTPHPPAPSGMSSPPNWGQIPLQTLHKTDFPTPSLFHSHSHGRFQNQTKIKTIGIELLGYFLTHNRGMAWQPDITLCRYYGIIVVMKTLL